MRTLAPALLVALTACSAAPAAPPSANTVSIAPPPETASAAPLVPRPRPVHVQLFMMAHDPYVRRLLPDLADVIGRFGPDADLQVDFIGTADAEGGLASMRGPDEVQDDLVKVCAKKHAPQWLSMFACDTEDEVVVGAYKGCARTLGIDLGPIEACAAGAEGKELLARSFAKAREAQANGSPTIVVGQERYVGARHRRPLLRRICEAFEGPKPALCASISEAPPVTVRILTDARCPDCGVSSLKGEVGAGLDKPVFSEVDYASPEGQALYAAIGRATVPTAVFDDSLDADAEVATSLMRRIKKAGSQRIYQSGDWLPHCADKGACSLDECKASPACVAEVPKKIEIFIMSKCPFGAKAILAMPDVLKAFKKTGEKLDLQVSYIGEGSAARGFTSMHGPAEVEEDVRAVCAIKHYAKNAKFLDYLTCRASNQRSDDWKACTGKNGIAPKVIEDCVSGSEGPALLEASFARAKARRVKASPTLIINDKFRGRGLTVEAITGVVCEHNAPLRACKTASAKPPAPSTTPPVKPPPPRPSNTP